MICGCLVHLLNGSAAVWVARDREKAAAECVASVEGQRLNV